MSIYTRAGAPHGIKDIAAGHRNGIVVSGARKASGSIKFTANFAAGDVVTVAGVAFTAVAAAAGADEFVIGASLSASLDALVTLINASVDSGVAVATYSKSGTDTLVAVADTAGEAGDGAVTLATAVAGAVITAVAGGADSDKIDIQRNSVFLVRTNANAAQAFALVDGEDLGQVIVLYLLEKGASASATFTGAFKGGATLTLDTVDKFAELVWIGTKWSPIVNTGAISA